MILPIYTYGQPLLRKVSEDINPDMEGLDTLIENMYETMYDSDGIGLAAPQIGLSKRILVIDLSPLEETFPEYKDYKKVFINPHILEKDESSGKSTYEEGCLSVPGIHEPVVRPNRIRLKYMDKDMQPHEEWVEGYLARVLQHEIDHLDGYMFVDRISPLRKQLIKNKLKNIMTGKFKCAYRTKPYNGK